MHALDDRKMKTQTSVDFGFLRLLGLSFLREMCFLEPPLPSDETDDSSASSPDEVGASGVDDRARRILAIIL